MTGALNAHLKAYQELYPSSGRSSTGTDKGRSRYFLNDGPKPVCWACLGEHESTSCVQKRCYRCAKPGHESNQCRSQAACRMCSSMGHSQSHQCFLHVYNAGLDPRLHSRVHCLACGDVGHINCSSVYKNERETRKRRRM